MENTKLIEALRTIAKPYESRYFSRAVDYAQDQLMGRTHYVDPHTLKCFHSRVLAARPLCDGALFMITESSAKDPYNETRGFRCVVFDVFGEVVFRRSLDEMLRNGPAAEKDMLAWLAGFDPVDYYAMAIRGRSAAADRERMRLEQAADAVRSIDRAAHAVPV